jgi:hypothetical protein
MAALPPTNLLDVVRLTEFQDLELAGNWVGSGGGAPSVAQTLYYSKVGNLVTVRSKTQLDITYDGAEHVDYSVALPAGFRPGAEVHSHHIANKVGTGIYHVAIVISTGGVLEMYKITEGSALTTFDAANYTYSPWCLTFSV